MSEPTKLTALEVEEEITSLQEVKAPQVDLTASVDVSSVTPSKVGLLVRDASNVLYISTGTSVPGDWTKVGTQT